MLDPNGLPIRANASFVERIRVGHTRAARRLHDAGSWRAHHVGCGGRGADREGQPAGPDRTPQCGPPPRATQRGSGRLFAPQPRHGRQGRRPADRVRYPDRAARARAEQGDDGRARARARRHSRSDRQQEERGLRVRSGRSDRDPRGAGEGARAHAQAPARPGARRARLEEPDRIGLGAREARADDRCRHARLRQDGAEARGDPAPARAGRRQPAAHRAAPRPPARRAPHRGPAPSAEGRDRSSRVSDREAALPRAGLRAPGRCGRARLRGVHRRWSTPRHDRRGRRRVPRASALPEGGRRRDPTGAARATQAGRLSMDGLRNGPGEGDAGRDRAGPDRHTGGHPGNGPRRARVRGAR